MEINNETLHVLKNLGLPYKEDPSNFGNLYITYKLIFPSNLAEDRKELLKRILPIREPLPEKSYTLQSIKLEEIITSPEELDSINDNDVNINESVESIPDLPFSMPNLDIGNIMKELPIKELTQCSQQ